MELWKAVLWFAAIHRGVPKVALAPEVEVWFEDGP